MKHRSVVLTVLGLCGTTPAMAAQPDALCHDPALTHQERDLCVEQIKHAQTLPEQKAIQEKFRKRITERAAKK
jgi:hypothetical protein